MNEYQKFFLWIVAKEIAAGRIPPPSERFPIKVEWEQYPPDWTKRISSS